MRTAPLDCLHRPRVAGRLVLIPALLCLLALLAGPAFAAAAITVKPDRDPVRMDETFNLEFSSADDVDDDPDFSPLAGDFEILGQNQGSQVSIVNGKMSQTRQWTVTLSPKRAGALAIPPIAFGSDRSPPASVTVLAAGGAAPGGGGEEDNGIRLEMEASPKNPYVQAQVILTVRVLMRVNMAGGDLSEPSPADALVERLGEDRRYSTSRNGREYAVVERQYAVFPQKSGLLRIDPLHLTAQVEVGGRSFFSRSVRAVRVKSEAVDLKVRPQPPEFTGAHWLPAADLRLEESWSQNPPQVKTGDPITRTLALRARGATVSLLPELGADQHLDASIKQYPDQPALNEDKQPSAGVSASREEKIALIPGRPGEYTLPEVAVPWWNTQTERMETARIPARILKVEASGEPAPQAAPPEPLPRAEPAAPAAQAPLAAAGPAEAGLWFWLALAFGLGWLTTALAWWLSRRRPQAPAPTQPAPAPDGRQARKALRQACAQNDPAAARRALLAWAQTRWPGRESASLEEVAALGGGGLAEAVVPLNRALYGSRPEAWRGEALWAAVEAAGEGGGKPGGGKESTLEPLYR